MKKELIELYSLCFDDSSQYIDYFFSSKYEEANTLIYRKDDRIISALFIIPKSMTINGVSLLCPYIAGACTHPNYRGKGIMNNLIYNCFNVLYNRDIVICSLYPFKHSFYEKQGFQTITHIEKKSITYYDDSSISLRQAENDDAELLNNFYNNYIKAFDCYLRRDNIDFINKLNEVNASPGRTTLAFNNTGDLKGYIMYDDEEIIEAIGTGFEKITDLHSRQYEIPSNNGIKSIMARIIKPIQLLESISFPNIELTIRLKLRDSIIEHNNIIIGLNINNGKCQITPCSQFDYELTIEQLTLLVTGAYLKENYIPEDVLQSVFPTKNSFIVDKY